MHNSKARDGAPAPGPTFMSSKQMADYLQDLRSNRIARPNGSRPPPSQFGTWSGRSSMKAADESPAVSPFSQSTFNDADVDVEAVPQPVTVMPSHRRTNSAMSNRSIDEVLVGRPLVQLPRGREREISASISSRDRTPSVQYRENVLRQAEREQARALRIAMEQIDLEDDEKLYNAALDEAAELVWKHQNPDALGANPHAPYPYPGPVGKGAHARSKSLGRDEPDLQNSHSKLRKRHSMGSNTSGSRSSSLQSHRAASSSSASANADFGSPGKRTEQGKREKTSSVTAEVTALSRDFKGKRRSSSSSRRVSGSIFKNPEDKIYEEPEEETPVEVKPVPPTNVSSSLPLQTRRNPFSRVKFAKENLGRSNTDPLFGNRRFDKIEIQNNPPTQSRNAGYTMNPPLPKEAAKPSGDSEQDAKMKDGKEIRSDDLRAATSMRLKDRSPKLPTPTLVSDTPGRPIVSFSNDWKPKEIELKGEISSPPTSTNPSDVTQKAHFPSSLTRAATVPVEASAMSRSRDQVSRPLPFVARNKTSGSAPLTGSTASVPVNRASIPVANKPHDPGARPSSRFSGAYKVNSPSPTIPTINVSETPPARSKTSSMPPIPTISVQETPSRTVTPDSVPKINVPSISVSPCVPTISVDEPSGSTRPLPNPKHHSSKPFPRGGSVNTKSHWTPTNVRTGALCSYCALPIAGRIVSAAGVRFHPECFRCHHCGEHLECVAFYPEPDNKRAERLERIHKRMNGEDIEVIEGVDMRRLEEQDGDEGMRFYCHLDYHEMFSPRCKSCKTPIEGEVVVACGAEWHVGHFFCAQCGDPFDSSTPFVEKDGYAWCVNCHTNRYSTKCRKCRKPVTDTVVKALGAEWHVNCFCCVECSGQFKDGRYFLRGDSQDPVCVQCEERRLKS